MDRKKIHSLIVLKIIKQSVSLEAINEIFSKKIKCILKAASLKLKTSN
jgi:hypothetical protein